MEDNVNKILSELPIDVYTRHYIAKNIIDTVVRQSNNKLSILDVGGYKGWTKTFFPLDKVLTLDVYESKQEDYVQGDATAMTFADESFDIVTSFDVFEHIPRNKRQDFINESIRVAKEIVIITVPTDATDAGETSGAENNLNNFYKILTNKQHPWLKEHIEYGIPSNTEIENLLNKQNIIFKSIKSNNIHLWQIIESINFLGTVDQSSLDCAKRINSIYNTNTEDLEFGNNGESYRTVYVIFKNKPLLKKFDAYLLIKHKQYNLENTTKVKNEIIGIFLDHVATLMNQGKDKDNTIDSLNTRYNEKALEYEKKLQTIYTSKSWRLTKPLRHIMRKIRE